MYPIRSTLSSLPKVVSGGVCLLLALSTTGCPTSAIKTDVGFLVQTKYTLNTKQVCAHPEELTRILNFGVPCLLRATIELGPAPAGAVYRAYQKMVEDEVMFCLVDQPEACGYGPCADHPLCQRRRGCTYGAQVAWNATRWPPVCHKDWPQEAIPLRPGGPHRVGCVKHPGQQSTQGYESDVLHEAQEMLWARLRLGSAHTDLARKVLHQANRCLQEKL